MKSVQPDLDFADTAKWFLCSAEKPIEERLGGGFHAMLMLVQQNTGGVSIIDELHFKPSGNQSGSSDAIITPNLEPTRPDAELLVPSAYTKPGRKIDDLAFQYIYTSGSPRQILPLWSEALRAAVIIKNLRRPYGDRGNCRAGIKGVVESIGFRFETLDHPRTRRGLDTNFAAEIDFNPNPSEKPIETAIIEWQRMRGLLARRSPKPAAAETFHL